jgi:hypothetical protein
MPPELHGLKLHYYKLSRLPWLVVSALARTTFKAPVLNKAITATI